MPEMTMSFSKGKANETSIKHNNRSLYQDNFDYEKVGHKHIKPEYTELNEVLVHEDIRDIYKREFGQAVKEYNQKQKRKDRKIKDYYSKVKNSKNQRTQIEFMVQVGNMDDYKDVTDRFTSRQWQDSKQILENYFENFKKRNPNLIPYNAVIHMDESTPHLHLNVVPVAHLPQAKRGLKVKPSLDRALDEEGYKRSERDNRQQWKDFQHAEAQALADEAMLFGIDRKAGIQNKLKDVHQYKQVMREIEDLQEQKRQVDTQVRDKQAQLDSISSRELAVAEREKAVTEKEQRSSELDKEIRRKEFVLKDWDKKEQNARDSWKAWGRTVEKMARAKNLGSPDDYLVVGTFGAVDKDATKDRIAKLLELAGHGKSIKEVEAENRKLRNQGIEQYRSFVREKKTIGEVQRQKEQERLKKRVKEQDKKIREQQKMILQLRMFADAAMRTIRGIAKAIPERAHKIWKSIGANLHKVGGQTYIHMRKDEISQANEGYSKAANSQKSRYNQYLRSRDLDR